VKFESVQDFRAWKGKQVSLLGMSGVGKTYLASRLPRDSWFHFSVDYRIGTHHLRDQLLDTVKAEAMKVKMLADLLRSDSISIHHNITFDNLSLMSTYVGKLGDPTRGGLSKEEFKSRQAMHLEAEIRSMLDIRYFIDRSRAIYAYEHFVNDASGSICEIVDLDDPNDAVIRILTEDTLVLYIRASDEHLDELIARAENDPKPLYYQEKFLDRNLKTYLRENNISNTDQIDPDDFTRWIFPRLVAHRRPLYERLADLHGYTVTAQQVMNVQDEAGFLALIEGAIEDEAKLTAPARASGS
jgi:hypothetical protein